MAKKLIHKTIHNLKNKPKNEAPAESERVQKLMANAGICSRRRAEELIEQGKVSVNDQVITIGDKANPDTDLISVEGKVLKKQKKIYVLLNKPPGYETTLFSPQNRKKVTDLIKIKERIIPVGRLDLNSRGLLILTNDGNFANKIMHPRYEKEKTYEATVKGIIPESKLKMLERGMDIGIANTSPCDVKILKQGKKFMRLAVKIKEGKNRQIRRMFQRIGYNVEDLARTKIGDIGIGKLKEGKFRHLTQTEVAKLLEK
ncbi:rRNA pseudouridine synthase [Candidatus Woesearchaeota archaeon]|nr:rRNA pseudouridine synthase [Candidatus Woesearchaeota archaeon]MCF7900603.1 rRNA pseudouridine synthase [Candidatus Woesearchaeota archaeon]MCF8013907.1 rRNA pseudouridine synthase [Candidatus Woesearchaeota archaeon]